MPRLPCKICGKKFYAKPNWIKLGYGKYCSIACRSTSQRKGKIVKCSLCGESVYRGLKHFKHSKSGKYFCNKKCQALWRNSLVYVGASHSNWKGGWSIYRKILIRAKVPVLCLRCGLDDQRILAVHHIDRNRKNNALSNLVWLCPNCHFLIHHDKLEWQKFMMAASLQ